MEFTIRPMEAGDGEGLHSFRLMPGVMENILAAPSERVEFGEQFASRVDHNTHSFVAVTMDDEGEELIIGLGCLEIGAMPRTRHSAEIALMVHRDYQGRGVGTRLMEALVDLADNWLMLVRLSLTVFADNERAIRLYERFGFVKEGRRVKAAIRAGKYEDEWMMGRVVVSR